MPSIAGCVIILMTVECSQFDDTPEIAPPPFPPLPAHHTASTHQCYPNTRALHQTTPTPYGHNTN